MSNTLPTKPPQTGTVLTSASGGMTLETLTEHVVLAEALQKGRPNMLEPQDLPGRFGRSVKAIDAVLRATGISAVLGGGWAVWRHGFTARVTQDLDIALPADAIEEFMKVACVFGFESLPHPPGRRPKLRHKESNTNIDILPEKARPGSAARPAPTTIPHPGAMGGTAGRLCFMQLPSLVELKLAAGRVQDDADLIVLIQVHSDSIDDLHAHLQTIHPDYVGRFECLVARAREQEGR